MRIAVLVKQIPKFDEMALGADGRLVRAGIEPEMNPYCRRAVGKACELATEFDEATVTVLTLGPPAADDVLREAIAWGLERDVDISGVHVTDPLFAGSDTLATAKALTAALTREGPFDLVLTGRNSVDADTGQVGPQVAALLDLPFLTGVRHLSIEGTLVSARCEHDDGWLQAAVELPAMLSTAERLCEPAKVEPPGRAAVPAERIRRISAADLGPGPWGAGASPTWVGNVKVLAVERAHLRWPDAPVEEQASRAVEYLHDRGALAETTDTGRATVRESQFGTSCVAVLCEPGRLHQTRELLGAAAALTGNVLAITIERPEAGTLVGWGADEIIFLDGANIEEDIAKAVVGVARSELPSVMLAPSTAWGREVASRAAALLDTGLVGDAVDLEMTDDGWLRAWKPAFGGQLVAAIGMWTAGPQMATVRAGVLLHLRPRPAPGEFIYETRPFSSRDRIRVLARTRDDDLDVLAEARVVIGVGTGVGPDEYDELEPLRILLGAELAATRKVTDRGWLPRSRQVGITGRSIAPRLYVSIGASGKFNHAVGVRAAGTVVAINPDPNAPIWESADVGIVADWHDALPALVARLGAPAVTPEG
ncbi:MAG: FAD-binding protein [Actinomycetota bacterium]